MCLICMTDNHANNPKHERNDNQPQDVVALYRIIDELTATLQQRQCDIESLRQQRNDNRSQDVATLQHTIDELVATVKERDRLIASL